MTHCYLPATRAITEIFTEEVRLSGGSVAESFDCGNNLFLRAVLPAVFEARSDDGQQAGVALRTRDREILVHPYVFRQVCRNGAIFAKAIETQPIERLDNDALDAVGGDTLGKVREAVRACTSAESFATVVTRIRSATEIEADLVLQLAPMIKSLPAKLVGGIMSSVMNRFTSDGDRTAFGLMNAITSVARDTRDPDIRWRLEEFGGGISACLNPVLNPDAAAMLLAV